MMITTIKLIAIFSILSCTSVFAIPKNNLQQIKNCVSVGGTRGQASPPKSITVVGSSNGFYLLRIFDRAGNPFYERIIKLNPCKTVYIDQGGETPSKYGIPSLSMEIIDNLSLQSVQYDIRMQGKKKYFAKILSRSRDGKLELTPEIYKALKKEGFTTRKQVILFNPKLLNYEQ